MEFFQAFALETAKSLVHDHDLHGHMRLNWQVRWQYVKPIPIAQPLLRMQLHSENSSSCTKIPPALDLHTLLFSR